MQLGFTTTEKMEFTAGQVTNASLADYKIPGFLDLPSTIISEVVDTHQHNGPFGAKGVGESGTFSVSPAIANAVEDAIGVRITALPITPEVVYLALRAARGEPVED
jgi:CO/xanthine dehydrogenase Mo-binding subunit